MAFAWSQDDCTGEPSYVYTKSGASVEAFEQDIKIKLNDIVRAKGKCRFVYLQVSFQATHNHTSGGEHAFTWQNGAYDLIDLSTYVAELNGCFGQWENQIKRFVSPKPQTTTLVTIANARLKYPVPWTAFGINEPVRRSDRKKAMQQSSKSVSATIVSFYINSMFGYVLGI